MYKRILFATDFDDVGVRAAKKAKKIAEENQAELHFSHVIEPIPAYAYPGFAGFSDVELSIQTQAEQELASLSDELGVDSAHRHLEFGSIKHEILRLAKELDIDLIVAGSHGKHGLALLLGSTAAALLHGAECDVLIVRTASSQPTG